ncbi:MAG: chemotaxis protein CheW [bacterium]
MVSNTKRISDNVVNGWENVGVEEAENTIQMVSFLISNGLYGMDISNIREIIKVDRITHVPGSSEYIEGVMNLRGMVIPIVDSGKLLGLSKITPSDDRRIIIIEIQSQTQIGLLVDAVIDIVNILPDRIGPPPATLGKDKAKYIKGEVQIGVKLMAILDMKDAGSHGD